MFCYILGWDSLVINRFNCREFPKPMGFKLLARVFQLPKKLLKVSFHWMVENWICVPSLVFVSNTGKPPTIMTWHICRFSEKSVISFRLLNKDIALSSFMHSEIVVQVQDFKVGLRWRFPVRNKPITEPIRRAPKSASFCLETSSKKKKKQHSSQTLAFIESSDDNLRFCVGFPGPGKYAESLRKNNPMV